MDASEAAEIIAFVKEIIGEEGRTMTLVKFDQTPANPATPHRVGKGDPFADPETTLELKCVFVPLSSLQDLGMGKVKMNLYSKADVVGLIEPSSEEDLSLYNGMIDGASRYLISTMDRLKPGDYTFLWSFAGAVRNAT